jgi:hypothetical protein
MRKCMSMSSRTVVILGAGPSGLLVAHAAVRAGLVPHIWSKSNGSQHRKSRIYGCQYLHAEIPDLRVATTEVDYKVWGKPEVYRDKVYGSEMAGEVSPSYLEGTHQAWDLRAAYDRLWAAYVGQMVGGAILVHSEFGSDGTVAEFTKIYPKTPIISTIPAQVLCVNPAHKFSGQDVWAMGDAPEMGRSIPAELPDNTVICNGLRKGDGPLWYRGSRVFGYGTLEWSGDLRPKDAVKVTKPLSTDCDCWSDRITRMGRYGEWKKGVLTSDAFDQATKLFSEM